MLLMIIMINGLRLVIIRLDGLRLIIRLYIGKLLGLMMMIDGWKGNVS